MSNSGGRGKRDKLKEKMNAFQKKCREAGLKVTPQRMAVYKVLIESKQHPSAEMVCRKVREVIPNISLDTVNRTLLTLARIGAASIVEGSGDVKRFDGCLETHQHFKCINTKESLIFIISRSTISLFRRASAKICRVQCAGKYAS